MRHQFKGFRPPYPQNSILDVSVRVRDRELNTQVMHTGHETGTDEQTKKSSSSKSKSIKQKAEDKMSRFSQTWGSFSFFSGSAKEAKRAGRNPLTAVAPVIEPESPSKFVTKGWSRMQKVSSIDDLSASGSTPGGVGSYRGSQSAGAKGRPRTSTKRLLAKVFNQDSGSLGPTDYNLMHLEVLAKKGKQSSIRPPLGFDADWFTAQPAAGALSTPRKPQAPGRPRSKDSNKEPDVKPPSRSGSKESHKDSNGGMNRSNHSSKESSGASPTQRTGVSKRRSKERASTIDLGFVDSSKDSSEAQASAPPKIQIMPANDKAADKGTSKEERSPSRRTSCADTSTPDELLPGSQDNSDEESAASAAVPASGSADANNLGSTANASDDLAGLFGGAAPMENRRTAEDLEELRKQFTFAPGEMEELIAVFDSFDKDAGGSISSNELRSMLRYLGQTATPRKIYEVVKQFDVDGSGEVELSEFLAFMQEFNNEQVAEMTEAFEGFDEDESGEISVSELEALLEHLGREPSKAQMKQLLNEFDSDGSGTFSFDEFFKIYKMHSDMEKQKAYDTACFDEDELEDFKEAFDSVDRDRSGELSVQELFGVLEVVGQMPKTKEQQKRLEEKMHEADADQSGQLSFKEFLHLVRRFMDELECMEYAREKRAGQHAGVSEDELNQLKDVWEDLREECGGDFTMSAARSFLRSIGVTLTPDKVLELRAIFKKFAFESEAALEGEQQRGNKMKVNAEWQKKERIEAEEHRWEVQHMGALPEGEPLQDEILNNEHRTFDVSEPPTPYRPPKMERDASQKSFSSETEDPPAKMTLSFPRFLFFLGDLLKRNFASIKESSLQTVAKCEEEKVKMAALLEQVQQNRDRRQTSKEAQKAAVAAAREAAEEFQAKEAFAEALTQEEEEKAQDRAFLKWYESEKLVLAERKVKFLKRCSGSTWDQFAENLQAVEADVENPASPRNASNKLATASKKRTSTGAGSKRGSAAQ